MTADPHAQLEALRRSGRWRADPARFRYLEALARRAGGQPEPVRRLLQVRLRAGVAEYVQRIGLDGQAPAARQAATRTPPSPLAQLNRALRQARPASDAAADGEELASARRFRSAWDARRALEKLDLALARKPAQAGPLNSHALLLESLELMRTLSPSYLRRFMLRVETLQWLAAASEHAGEQPKAKKSGKAAKPVRARPPK